MTQEDRKLLLKDLCARLPYGVKGLHREQVHSITIMDASSLYPSLKVDGYDAWFPIETFKPFLRPMSSMTEEEDKEYAEVVVKSQNCSYENNESATTMVNDWYLSKGFDVRCLIPKGLALEAPKDMYK